MQAAPIATANVRHQSSQNMWGPGSLPMLTAHWETLKVIQLSQNKVFRL